MVRPWHAVSVGCVAACGPTVVDEPHEDEGATSSGGVGETSSGRAEHETDPAGDATTGDGEPAPACEEPHWPAGPLDAPEGGVLLPGCEDEPYLWGTEEAFLATPRGDDEIERLALKLGDSFFADEALYARLLADIHAIRCGFPDTADISFNNHVSDDLTIELTEAARADFDAGTYHAWDCLNAWYGLVPTLDGDRIRLHGQGNYATDDLVDVYRTVPGVFSASTGGWGDASTICVTIDGETFRWLLDRRGGDCPAGCTEHHTYGFQSSAPGIIEPLGEWDSQSREPRPAWVLELQCP